MLPFLLARAVFLVQGMLFAFYARIFVCSAQDCTEYLTFADNFNVFALLIYIDHAIELQQEFCATNVADTVPLPCRCEW